MTQSRYYPKPPTATEMEAIADQRWRRRINIAARALYNDYNKGSLLPHVWKDQPPRIVEFWERCAATTINSWEASK